MQHNFNYNLKPIKFKVWYFGNGEFFTHSVYVTALNEHDAIEKAKKEVSGVYGQELTNKMNFQTIKP